MTAHASVYRFELFAPLGVPMLSANTHGAHWAPQAQATARWRQAAREQAATQGLPTGLRFVEIWGVLQFPDNRRRDAANWHPTVKPIIDGLVDHGLIPDDRPAHLAGPYLDIGAPLAPTSQAISGLVTLVIKDLSEARDG